MRVRYSFSSRHTRRARDRTASASREKFPDLMSQVINESDIIIEVLDARYPEETRNIEVEKRILDKKKKIIYILNKADLATKRPEQAFSPMIYVSCRKRKGIKQIREQIKIMSKKINKEGKIIVGVIGYPNTGKSSLINILIGRNSAGTGADAGFTKGIQKLKLTGNITLLDSPGVIPKAEYSSENMDAISRHVKVGGRSYSQVRDPDIVISSLMKDYLKEIEGFYNLDSGGDSDIFIEKLGRKMGFLKKGGEVNEDKTARLILKDWQIGNIQI